MFYARNTAETLRECLVLANMYRLMQEPDEVQEWYEKARQLHSPFEKRLEMVSFQRWVMLDEDEAYQLYYEQPSEHESKSMTGYYSPFISLIQCNVSIFQDWQTADFNWNICPQ